ncbi:MAG: electron transfer flavoprotein-ubiquinone oxidoreductase [Pseudomonadota bacterium]|nr:electron transfer flavoprotein-ubiquinone oxidoreductase [Pseudomonadota bacterium]
MSERDVMEYDVVIVGAGPAGLAMAIRLKQIKPALSVCVIEKASTVGAHVLSGAVIEPGPLDELLPGWRENPPPICVAAADDEMWWLSKSGGMKLPTPPQLSNHGNFIVSLGAMCAWMAPQAETLGVEIYPGFAAAETLHDDSGAVIGVRIGDMGVAKDGTHKPGYAQGIDIRAKVTVLAEGARGHLTKRLVQRFKLDADCDPQTYSIGIKELWQLPPGRVKPGKIVHGLGWPADNATYGGFFLYHLDKDRVAVGYVVGLDYRDSRLSPFELFQQIKHHPKIKPLLEGGSVLSYGSRAIASGGYQSLPNCEMPGALLIGDCAGTLNLPKIKGTHQAIRGGMLAAMHVAEYMSSKGWDAALRASVVMSELKKVRNFKPGFHKGLWIGLINSAWETISGGRSPWTLHNHADHAQTRKITEYESPRRDFITEKTLPPRDRLASVFYASTQHDEDQPVHLRVSDTSICVGRCATEYDNPCTRFCPAGVYEMVGTGAERRLQINAANCVHCKTCDIKDPYQIIDWVTPEGGAGPNYQNL